MRKIVLVCVCFVSLITNGFAQGRPSGEKGISSIGGIVGYAIESDKAVIGIDYRYNILNRMRLAPSVMYIFEKYNHDILYFNADVHYLARITPKITLYPIGGIGISAHRDKYLLGNHSSVNTDICFGVNLGFGGELRITKDIIVGAEFKYNWTKMYYNQAMLLGRVAYYF